MAGPVGFQPLAFEANGFQAGSAVFLFGSAIISIPSQIPIQPVRTSLIEGSAFAVNISYFDIFNSPGIPVSVFYQILERVDAFPIVGWTQVVPNFTNAIFVSSANNTVISASHKLSETHLIQFKITDGSGNIFYRSMPYDVLRDIGTEGGAAPANEPAFQLGAFEIGGFQQGTTP